MTPISVQQLKYQSGFGNEFATEAVKGALPVGRNSPQIAPLGLYAEQFSGTSFTTPRLLNKRTWTYRIQPSVLHKPFRQIENKLFVSKFDEIDTTPNQLRWNPLLMPETQKDFIDGIVTMAGCGDSFSRRAESAHSHFRLQQGI
ncbi:MAG: homogentisate 1,2-dioxygenase [Pyrinomonadaceae bacterium]